MKGRSTQINADSFADRLRMNAIFSLDFETKLSQAIFLD